MKTVAKTLTACSLAIVSACCAEESRIDFNESVRPIFVRHCLACHGGVRQAGGLSFVTRDLAMTESDSGLVVIEPGDHEASYLYDRVADEEESSRMPPPEHGRGLNPDELAILRRWINQGARWDNPWAFRAPRRSDPGAQTDWARGPVDAFVYDRLQAGGLEPAPEADRAQWLRRVSFDLIGLPPSEEERLEFESDQSPGAHERVVDRLLASPHFGERWASVWLDLSRYADTKGFERDPPRTIWPWRDWVVRVLNADLPYNEFLLKQTAGDLLPGATLEDRLATAHHRNTQTNIEGGTDDEEFRWEAVVDRVDSTWAGVLGMTMGCARCHDHPYDPLSQQDYYRFAALFNTTRDADLTEDWPLLPVPSAPSRYAEADRLMAQQREVRREIHRVGFEACASTEWTPLAIDSAESTGETRLVIRNGERGNEVVAEGTLTDRSRYTIRTAPPPGPITAVRLDAGPKDPQAARRLPEVGFVITRVRLLVERHSAGDSEPRSEEVLLTEAFVDEVDGFHRPNQMLLDGPQGWGPYTRIRNNRWAVFLLDEPLTLAKGERLRLDIKHEKALDGQGPLTLKRFKLSISGNERFARLAHSERLQSLRARDDELAAALAKIPSAPTPVLVEQEPTLRRESYLLDRGNWLAPTEGVRPATPERLPGGADDRLALGRWLGSADNPLTSRVMVNRVWAELFGRGLVETLEDFGSTGAKPSHPRLLDDMAHRFPRELGWSLKSLLRELVLSATYRQDAHASADQIARDPSNRLLARGPRERLRAEMVRDQALVLSGRFNPLLGGEPVMPYQPDGVWQSVHSTANWKTSDGPDRYRRALYTYWKRTAAYPSLVAFDAPSREQCTVRRVTTNTPLQALVTLNDPAFLDLAEGLADRMLARAGENTAEQIAWGGHLATGRPLDAASVRELDALYHQTLDQASTNQRFAMTIVANVMLNLDAALTK